MSLFIYFGRIKREEKKTLNIYNREKNIKKTQKETKKLAAIVQLIWGLSNVDDGSIVHLETYSFDWTILLCFIVEKTSFPLTQLANKLVSNGHLWRC